MALFSSIELICHVIGGGDQRLWGVPPVQVSAGKVDLTCECHICMDTFKRGTKILQLPCEHRFCQLCIRKWLYDHRTCPVCRYEFPDSQTIFIK